MVTIKDIAKACNVSISTVSYALNNDPRIPDKTRAIIHQKAKKLGYEGKSGKKPIKINHMKQIVFCLHSINGNLYTEVFDAIHHILHISDCKTHIYCGNRVDNIPWMDGLICLNSRLPADQIRDLTNRKIPVVLMDRNNKFNNVSNVILDNFQGGYEVTKTLINKGAKSFIYISGPGGNQDANLRYEGFCKALKDNDFNPKKVVIYQGDYTKNTGANIANNILSVGIKTDAIVCANDEMAMGVMDEFKKAGYKVGQDIFVAGFDGIAPKSYVGYVTAYFDCGSWGSLATYTLLRDFEKPSNTIIKIPVEVMEY